MASHWFRRCLLHHLVGDMGYWVEQQLRMGWVGSVAGLHQRPTMTRKGYHLCRLCPRQSDCLSAPKITQGRSRLQLWETMNTLVKTWSVCLNRGKLTWIVSLACRTLYLMLLVLLLLLSGRRLVLDWLTGFHLGCRSKILCEHVRGGAIQLRCCDLVAFRRRR